jgi:hypothetical protein
MIRVSWVMLLIHRQDTAFIIHTVPEIDKYELYKPTTNYSFGKFTLQRMKCILYPAVLVKCSYIPQLCTGIF